MGEDELPRAYYPVVSRSHVSHFYVVEGPVHAWSDFSSEVWEAHRVYPYLLEPEAQWCEFASQVSQVCGCCHTLVDPSAVSLRVGEKVPTVDSTVRHTINKSTCSNS